MLDKVPDFIVGRQFPYKEREKWLELFSEKHIVRHVYDNPHKEEFVVFGNKKQESV